MAIQWTRDTSVTLPLRETQVLSMGVIRTGEIWNSSTSPYLQLLMPLVPGSSSITEALTILGYNDVHHGITATPRE